MKKTRKINHQLLAFKPCPIAFVLLFDEVRSLNSAHCLGLTQDILLYADAYHETKNRLFLEEGIFFREECFLRENGTHRVGSRPVRKS